MKTYETHIVDMARDLRDLIDEKYSGWKDRYVVRAAIIKFLTDKSMTAMELAKVIQSIHD
jgi:hypothetical protein